MATSIAKLAVELALKHGRFDSGLTKAGKNVRKFSKETNTGSDALIKLGKAAAAAVAAGGLTMFIKSNLDAADKLGKTSDKLGIATEKLQAYRLAAEQMAGVGNQQFDMALQRMTRRLAEAENGTGEAVKALEALGIGIDQIRGRSPDEQMRIIADAMRGVESQSQRLAIAFKLFDSEGAALVNMLGDGADGLDQMEAKARSLGLTLTRDQAAAAEAANDALSDMTTAATSLGQQLVVKVAPAITATANAILDLTTNVERFDEKARRRALDGRSPWELYRDSLELVVDLENTAANDIDKRLVLYDKQNKMIAELRTQLSKLASTTAYEDISLDATSLGETLENLGVKFTVTREEFREATKRSEEYTERFANLRDVIAALGDQLNRTNSAVASDAPLKAATSYETMAEAVDKTRQKLVESLNQLNNEAAAREKLSGLMGAEIYAKQLAALDQANIERQALLQFHLENEQLIIQDHLNQQELAEIQSQQRLRALWQRSWADKAEITASAFSGLSALMQSEYRSLFEVGKAAAIAETVFSTYAAAQKQFDYFSAINPILAYTAAASAVAAGLVRVQAIRNTRFGSSSVQAAQAATATSAASGQGSQQTGGGGFNQEIVVQGSVVDVETLSDTFRDAAERNITITGIRSASDG